MCTTEEDYKFMYAARRSFVCENRNALDTNTAAAAAAQHQQHLAASLAKELTEATAIMKKSILLTGSSIL